MIKGSHLYNSLKIVVGLFGIIGFVYFALRFLSYVVTGESRLFPKDDNDHFTF